MLREGRSRRRQDDPRAAKANATTAAAAEPQTRAETDVPRATIPSLARMLEGPATLLAPTPSSPRHAGVASGVGLADRGRRAWSLRMAALGTEQSRRQRHQRKRSLGRTPRPWAAKGPITGRVNGLEAVESSRDVDEAKAAKAEEPQAAKPKAARATSRGCPAGGRPRTCVQAEGRQS